MSTVIQSPKWQLLAIIVIALMAVAVALMVGIQSAQATIQSPAVAGASASDLVAGTTDAKYNILFDTDVSNTATEITVTFPTGYAVAASPTITAGTDGQGTAGSIDVGGVEVTTTSVAGSGQVLTITLSSATDLSPLSGVAFRIETGITNPTTAGTTGLFPIISNASGESATSAPAVTITHATTKFVILDPTNGTVDAAITVTVQLQDQFNNVVTTGADTNKDVTLNATGSATGAGLVNIVAGVGTLDISDQVAETVNLSLTDTEATGFDVTSTQDVIFAPGTAAKLGFATEPVGGNRQSGDPTILTQPIVEVLDQFGNRVVTDPNGGTETISMAFQSGTNEEGATLSGTTTVNVDWSTTLGTAAFTDLAIDTVGSYNFTASDAVFSPDLTDVNSAAFTVSAVTFFVATTGNDSNDCLSSGSACLTINAAISKAINGDTVSVAAGTYAETVSIDKALTLQGVGATSIIQASSGHTVEVSASDITIDSLKIVGSTTGSAIRFLGNIIHDGITISNNTFLSPFTGVNLELRDVHKVTVDGNTFGVTAGSNVIISSDLSNLTGPIVFSNNTVSGNNGGSMVAFLRDFAPVNSNTVVTTIANVTISGNTFDNWDSRALRIGAAVTSVTVSQNSFLKTGASVEALKNEDTGTVTAVNNFWGKASGPGGTVGVGAGGDVVQDSGTVTFRPWLLEAGGATFDETIVLTTDPGDWTLFSAPQLLSAAPTVKDDAAGTVSMLAFVNGAFISPGATFDADVVKPVNAFYVKATNLAGIGFNFASPTSPGQTSKALIAGWNLVGTNSQALAEDELSSIQNTSQVGGVVTLFVPDTFNARKDLGHIDWTTNGDRDLNANPITALPNTNLSTRDGYWVFLNAARIFSKQLVP